MTLRVGLIGLGVVGAETARTLAKHASMIEARAGQPVVVTEVSARDRAKDRGVDLSACRWRDDPLDLARSPDVDLVCEVIGGEGGVALASAEAALGAGKHFVTANKAMIARHGARLAAMAEANGASIAFEAAVAGGIPVLKALKEGLAGNRIDRVYGILNGTCNFILTEMFETGRAFDDVLAEAQALGYAEADPTFDIDGVDAAQKLAILSAIAFGGAPDFDAVETSGIRQVSALDIAFAKELGYRIRLLGVAVRSEMGVEQRVSACMTPAGSALARIDGVTNAVMIEGAPVGQSLLVGPGAGGGATASAVVADIVDIAGGRGGRGFGAAAASLGATPATPISARHGAYYIRLVVIDRPGVIAEVAGVFGRHGVSIESVLQHGRQPEEPVPVVMTTHETNEATIRAVASELGALAAAIEPPILMRIESA
ncbi:MAG: homoserine dehydrogenase [Alphaproteobacteria bacterium]